MVSSNGFDFDELERLESQERERKQECTLALLLEVKCPDEIQDCDEGDEDGDDEDEVGIVKDGLFDYDVRCTVASGEPVKGLELPAVPSRAASARFLEASPDGPAALREAGNNCSSIKDWQQCCSLYSTALQSSPASPRLFSNRAAARLKLAKWEDALQDIMEATKRDPSNPKVCRCLRNCAMVCYGAVMP
eukprot:Skav203698  [mRNA]  locus=scaffold259:294957:297017:+ [translate_table: standard]